MLIKEIKPKAEARNSKQYQMTETSLCHCEELCDEAISKKDRATIRDCFASLAMTSLLEILNVLVISALYLFRI